MTATAHCLACAWTAAGTINDTDKASDKHTRQARHATTVIITPAAERTT